MAEGHVSDAGAGQVTATKVRNLFIFLGLGLLQLLVIFEGLAAYFDVTIPIFPLLFILLGFVAGGLLFIANF
ncbi:hypothetical protein [Halorientalis halophila]|uniref:hypothetical protein n=1 Tax=Halorientalis halophila TaxID=3108499 RepID=UPI00300BA37C